MSGRKGMKHYPKEVKLEAVRMFLEEGMTRREIQVALGLRNEWLVKRWVGQNRQEGVEAFHKPKGRPRKQAESEQAELERLRMENALLKKIIPNCERKCSRSAISGHLQAPRSIRSESDVSLLQDFASHLLGLGQARMQLVKETWLTSRKS